MSVWIKLDADYPTHPKTLRLCRLLGDGADAYPVRLWTWCARYAKDGKPDASFIEEACRWRGETGALIHALKTVCFLDSDGSVHDWDDWTGAFLHWLESRREANRKHMKKARKSGRNVDAMCTPRGQHVDNTWAVREEESREEKRREEKPTPTPSTGRGDAQAIGRIFAHYRKRFAKRDPYTLTPKRRQKIAARLDELGEEVVMTAITRASEDEWFREVRNDNGPEVILRSRDIAETWASKPAKHETTGGYSNSDGWLEAANAERERNTAHDPNEGIDEFAEWESEASK